MGSFRNWKFGIFLAGSLWITASVCKAEDPGGNASCRDGLTPKTTASATEVNGPTGQTAGKPHSVKLSWQASVPASKRPGDAIQGYNIYRREPGKKYEQINVVVIPQTACTDYTAKAGYSYVYQVQAVTVSGAVSKLSSDAHASLK